MGWINSLSDLYDYVINSDKNQGEYKIVPISNMTQNAQIEIIINKEGDFLRASIVPKNDAPTIIPCTISSASRTNPSPHPLHDCLGYLSADLQKYLEDQDKAEKLYEKNFIPYINQLKEWVKSDYSNTYIDSIYKYINKKTLVGDLIDSGIIKVDEFGKIIEEKIEKIDVLKAFIRIAIESDGVLFKTWEDINFQKEYSDYYLKTLDNEEKSLCYSSGEISFISRTHGKYIRYAGDGAKLLSSNDTSNYTYRGRFEKPEECAQISYEISEKAHSALRWIIRKQGHINDGYTIVGWSSKDSEIPNIIQDSSKFIFSKFNAKDSVSKKVLDSGIKFSDNLKKATLGYKSSFDKNEKVYIMALNNATQGRLSILYYRELDAGEFIDRLENWYKSISWRHNYKKDKETKKLYEFYGAASPIEIIKYSFGVQRGDFMDLDNKIINKQMERLLPCIIDGKRLPIDFIRGSFRNACSPETKSYYNWNKSLTIACGLIKKYYNERMEGDFDMKLNENEMDRSYLYGRLLAVLNRVEEVYLLSKEIDRPTKALTLFNAISKRPYTTYKTLTESVVPYFEKLTVKDRIKYETIISQILEKFEEEDEKNNRALSPRYIHGYFSQSIALRETKENMEGEK